MANQDVLIHLVVKAYGYGVCEYILIYVYYILSVSVDPVNIKIKIQGHVKFKNDKIE